MLSVSLPSSCDSTTLSFDIPVSALLTRVAQARCSTLSACRRFSRFAGGCPLPCADFRNSAALHSSFGVIHVIFLTFCFVFTRSMVGGMVSSVDVLTEDRKKRTFASDFSPQNLAKSLETVGRSFDLNQRRIAFFF